MRKCFSFLHINLSTLIKYISFPFHDKFGHIIFNKNEDTVILLPCVSFQRYWSIPDLTSQIALRCKNLRKTWMQNITLWRQEQTNAYPTSGQSISFLTQFSEICLNIENQRFFCPIHIFFEGGELKFRCTLHWC